MLNLAISQFSTEAEVSLSFSRFFWFSFSLWFSVVVIGKLSDELSIEEEAERKIGWLLKFFFAGTATFVAYQFFPYMGNLN